MALPRIEDIASMGKNHKEGCYTSQSIEPSSRMQVLLVTDIQEYGGSYNTPDRAKDCQQYR